MKNQGMIMLFYAKILENTLEYSLEVGFSHTTHYHLAGNHPLTFIKP